MNWPRLDLAGMKRLALALLACAAALYVGATLAADWHPAMGYVAAFAEAAMVGAVADWFAVVALFRHPMGLPIPHTAIIPANKERIGANLANFICTYFLSNEQVLAKLALWQPSSRLARWLQQPEVAERLGIYAVKALRAVLQALDHERLRTFVARSAAAGLQQIDFSRLSGQILGGLTAHGRHQELLDQVLEQLAELLQNENVQTHITEAIAQEVKTLRYLKLDQVAARLGTRKIVSAVARTLADVAEDAEHPLRARFDDSVQNLITRLQADPEFIAKGEALRDDLLGQGALNRYFNQLWDAVRQWMLDDLENTDSQLEAQVTRTAHSLGQWLQEDPVLCDWIDAQIAELAPRTITHYRETIRRYITERVALWNTEELTRELERNIGRDLQFIRINGTLVGGCVGLLIHTVTQALVR